MAEDTRQVIPERERIALRPDQAPPPSADELSAISAVMNCRADATQQTRFVAYFLKMTGVHGGEAVMSSESWAFNAGKRWVASTLLGMAEVQLVTLGQRKVLEKQTDG